MSAEHTAEKAHTPTTDELELIERMREYAAANGDYQGAAELAALLDDRETR